MLERSLGWDPMLLTFIFASSGNIETFALYTLYGPVEVVALPRRLITRHRGARPKPEAELPQSRVDRDTILHRPAGTFSALMSPARIKRQQCSWKKTC